MRGMHNRKAFKKVLPLFLASSMVLSNISVFATENTNGESNLALNKTTFSSGDETEGFNSTKVTDGIINRNANNGEILGFPGGPGVKNLPANAGEMDSIPGSGGSHMSWAN